jgi:succinate dehydrogenase/fumarate reductase cytochrome b subunit
MSGVVTLVIVLAVLAVVGGGIWYLMSGGYNYETNFGGGKKYSKECFYSYTKTNIVLALISVFIIYKIFSSY